MTTTRYVLKAEIADLAAATLRFERQKTMYGGKEIAVGDTVYLFASENEGGAGLVGAGVVTAARAARRPAGVERWTPRVSVEVRVTARATRPLGRRELAPFAGRKDGGAESELHFKLYRQATDKIVGVSEGTAGFLRGCVRELPARR